MPQVLVAQWQRIVILLSFELNQTFLLLRVCDDILSCLPCGKVPFEEASEENSHRLKYNQIEF